MSESSLAPWTDISLNIYCFYVQPHECASNSDVNPSPLSFPDRLYRYLMCCVLSTAKGHITAKQNVFLPQAKFLISFSEFQHPKCHRMHITYTFLLSLYFITNQPLLPPNHHPSTHTFQTHHLFYRFLGTLLLISKIIHTHRLFRHTLNPVYDKVWKFST